MRRIGSVSWMPGRRTRMTTPYTMGIEHTEEYWFMNGEELATFALQRVEVHDGLTIDAAVWSAAHGYHQDAQRLHNRALHGWGIVSGLQVVLVGEASRTV